MKKNYKHYGVYYVGTGSGCYANEYKKIYLGDTWAVSEAQACSRVRYRQRDKSNPNGGYGVSYLGDYLDEGMVKFEYKAYEI